MKITESELVNLTNLTWQEAVDFLENNTTKKDILEYCPDIADYEGNNWKKIEGIKYILAPYNFKDNETETKIETKTTGERKMKKLNKSQTWDKVQAAVKALQDLDQGLVEEDAYLVLSVLEPILAPKQGGQISQKINENNEVYCNYFETYKDPESFNKKRNKSGEMTFKANCILAEQILRKIKNTKANAAKQATDAFRTKLIDEVEFNDIMDRAEAISDVKYEKVMEVPTVADIVGLSLDK